MALSERYIEQLIGLQSRLYAYILTLLADTTAADDVLQEANLVLFRKADEFVPGTSFESWAFRIARIQCLAYWKFRSRDRLVFDEAALECVANRLERRLDNEENYTNALRDCLGRLPARQRELLEARYATGGSLKQLAEELGRTVGSVSQTLYRVRLALLDCIRSRLPELRVASHE